MLFFLIFGIAIGLVLILAAVLNWETIYGSLEFGLVAAVFGENAGRLTCLVAGIVVIGVSVAGYVARQV
jgi:hypothetical protein